VGQSPEANYSESDLFKARCPKRINTGNEITSSTALKQKRLMINKTEQDMQEQ